MKKFICIVVAGLMTLSASSQVTADPATFPIVLRYFSAEKQPNNSTILRWLAPCQTSEAKFEIESSADSKNFAPIFSLTADQERCFQPFQFNDTRVLNGKIFYRIKLITPANVSIYSYIIPVVSKGAGFELNSLWPSIVSSSAILNFSTGKNERIDFFIADINGRILQSYSQQAKAGNHQLMIECSKYHSGYYIIKAVNANKEIRTIRFQKR